MLRHIKNISPRNNLPNLSLNFRPCFLQPCCSSSSTKPEPKVQQNEEPKTETPTATQAPPSDKKTKQQEKAANVAVEEEDGAKKSLMGRFFGKIKTKIDDAAYDPVPSFYKYPMVKGFVLNQVDPVSMSTFCVYSRCLH